jgi:hypothetical protein
MKDVGFVFARVYNLLAGIPTRNILAIHEANRIGINNRNL